MGITRGFEYELLREYETHINQMLKNAYDKIKVLFIPVSFDQLLPSLMEGRGDIAAAGLTITPHREELVTFSAPYIPKVSEVVVRHPSMSQLNSIEDLAGREVYVRAGSSYVTHLKELNTALITENLPPIKIVVAEGILATEDILEMVHAGLVKIRVADHHIARAWAQVLPNIRIQEEIQIHRGGGIAWAVRPENPELLESLNGFIKSRKKGTLLGNILFKRYYENSKWINNPLTVNERKKLERVTNLFTKYSDRYGFDWLAIAAQAYQESELDNSKKSSQGAVGIMQILPNTAAGDPINIRQIDKLENNIHAGVKYLHYLRERYFSDPAIAPAAKVDFSWAAYNAGPARINRLRKIAAERGLDPNRWFTHVERIAAEKIGRETVSYVANINKYYIAYKLLFKKRADREKAQTEIVPKSNVGK
jgi:membrane-bound lytic murein transglycosylase MltF